MRVTPVTSAAILGLVADNGIGIPAAEQDRVFEKFFRASNAVRMVADGTRPGLYVAKKVLELVGGRIWFESVAGSSTTFYVALPRRGMRRQSGDISLAAKGGS